MASLQPTQEDIDTVVTFSAAAISAQRAAQLLREYDNNVESVIGAYFDNPTPVSCPLPSRVVDDDQH